MHRKARFGCPDLSGELRTVYQWQGGTGARRPASDRLVIIDGAAYCDADAVAGRFRLRISARPIDNRHVSGTLTEGFCRTPSNVLIGAP